MKPSDRVRTVAALYVQTGGVYYGLPGVDPWDEKRDARLYPRPHPVVAHPPCARWCRLAGLVEARWGHKRGDDGGCFAAALASVRTFGGVLEHPAYSDAWTVYGLPIPPTGGGWVRGLCGGWSCCVEQVRYGHEAKKATWLYSCGVDDLPSLGMHARPGVAGARELVWKSGGERREPAASRQSDGQPNPVRIPRPAVVDRSRRRFDGRAGRLRSPP